MNLWLLREGWVHSAYIIYKTLADIFIVLSLFRVIVWAVCYLEHLGIQWCFVRRISTCVLYVYLWKGKPYGYFIFIKIWANNEKGHLCPGLEVSAYKGSVVSGDAAIYTSLDPWVLECSHSCQHLQLLFIAQLSHHDTSQVLVRTQKNSV